jgi:hypothetical protein
MKLRWMLGMVGWALVWPALALGQATPYVALDDPIYADLDALVDAGWVRGALLGERPWSRLTAARYVSEARMAVAIQSTIVPARYVEALERLEAELQSEIERLCLDRGPEGFCVVDPPGLHLRSLSADATWADSPSRRIPTSYDFASSDYVDAQLNPLLERNQGRVLADGGTLAVEGALEAAPVGRFALRARPRLWALDARGGSADADATLLEAYARALFGNVAVELGRNPIALGHGREGGPILSRNARGLDLLRFSLDRPARLPWKLSGIGTLTASATIADMGGDSDTPHSKLVVFNGVLRPHPVLELSATLLNHQGGENAPTATLIQRLQDLFLIYPQGATLSDKVIGAGVALSLRAVRTRLYVDVFSTDDHNLFMAETTEALGTEAVWVGGARVTGLGGDGRFDLWVEGRKAGVRPHTHHQFTSGLTLDGRVIGDALGPLARALSGGVDWRGAAHRVTLGLAWERYHGGDFYENLPGDANFAWERTRDVPDETRARVTLDWVRDPGDARVRFGARLGYERVGTFNFAPGSRSNAVAQVRIDYRR